MMIRQAVFLISTADRKGLLAEISQFFYQRNLNILECRQYSDQLENQYFTRVAIELGDKITHCELERDFSRLSKKLDLTWSIHYSGEIPRLAVMVSKTTHCLYDLLMHGEEGTLGGKIGLVIGNHPELEQVADRFGIPFFCCPVTPGKQDEQEQQVLDLLRHHRVDLVVLARYMRILSDDFISCYPTKIINIHHAFLPAFRGGNPYRQAWERGVKMIGATAHYATADLDEGPIIEQDVERITHESSPEDLRRRGMDIERRVLTRAVRAHLEHRVIVSGRRTIVFAK